jgi:hypothetical protein
VVRTIITMNCAAYMRAGQRQGIRGATNPQNAAMTQSAGTTREK